MERGNSVTRRLIRRNCPSRSGCRRPSMVLRSVRLRTVAEFVQKTVYRAFADPVTLRLQPCRKCGRAVADPVQRALRTTATQRFKPALKHRHQLRRSLGQPLAAVTRPACPRARGRPVSGRHVTGCDILDTPANRRTGQTRRLGRARIPAPPGGTGFNTGPATTLPFVLTRTHHLEPVFQRFDHTIHGSMVQDVHQMGKLFWRESLPRQDQGQPQYALGRGRK